MRIPRALLMTMFLGLLAAPAQAAPPKLPDPTYKSVSKEVLVAMDDGVQIATTVAFPSQDGSTPLPGPFPVVLQMTPYGRTGVCGCLPADLFSTRGIVSVVADVRGTGGSGGNLDGNYFSPREARDGYQLVEHFGTQPWSSGKVGMAGGSYLGITQYMTAEQQPPHLTVITPAVAISDMYRDAYTHGGVQNLFFDAQYLAVQGAPGSAGPNSDPALLQATLAAKLGQSPPGFVAFDYLSRPNDDQFYRDRSPIYNADKITVPVLDFGQWHDGLLRGEPEMYAVLAKRRGVETRLFMDPCTHKGCGAPFDPLASPPGLADLGALVFEFLDKYLRGAPTPERPKVQYYLQQRNAYLTADRWPPAGTRYERIALGKGEASYVSDPAAGFSMAFDQYGTVAASPYVPTDQRLEGPHGFTFRTEPFAQARPLVGPLALHLVAASTATDTDWYAKLADVAPDGSESIITAGALRASHRALDPAKSRPERPYHTHTNPQPIEPGKFYDYDIEIWPTAYELQPGHRLQLRLTSSDLPTHLPGEVFLDRDHPEATRIDLFAPATNTLRLGESYLVAPVAGSPAPAPAPARSPAPAPVSGVPAPASAKPACKRSASRKLRLRPGRRTQVEISLRRAGHPLNARVDVRGPGFARHVWSSRRGRVTIALRPRFGGTTTFSTKACGAKLRVRA